jgi:WD40 repeat protein
LKCNIQFLVKCLGYFLADSSVIPVSLLVGSKKSGTVITCSEFSFDGWLLAVGDAKGVITVWVKKGDLGWGFLTKLDGHEGEISSIRFNERSGEKSDWMIASSSHDM